MLASLRRRSRWWWAALGGAALLALILGGHQVAPVVPAFARWVDGLGAAGPALFAASYFLACMLLLPASVLTMLAGALFGVVWGTVYTVAGAFSAIAAAFLVSRYLARDAITRRLANRPDLQRLDHAVADDGFRIVLLMRLAPVFPFSVLNYALGLTRIRYRDYLLASVGSIPGTLVFVNAGRLAGDIALIAAGEASPDSWQKMALLAIGLVAAVAVLVILARTARRALAEVAGLGRE